MQQVMMLQAPTHRATLAKETQAVLAHRIVMDETRPFASGGMDHFGHIVYAM